MQQGKSPQYFLCWGLSPVSESLSLINLRCHIVLMITFLKDFRYIAVTFYSESGLNRSLMLSPFL